MKNTMIVFVTCLLMISAILSVKNYDRKIISYQKQNDTIQKINELLEEKKSEICRERDSLQNIIPNQYFILDSIYFTNLNLEGE